MRNVNQLLKLHLSKRPTVLRCEAYELIGDGWRPIRHIALFLLKAKVHPIYENENSTLTRYVKFEFQLPLIFNR
jgi:hypothetical protein